MNFRGELTKDEELVMDSIIAVWNQYKLLDYKPRSESNQFEELILRLRQLLILRMARRLFPELWFDEPEGYKYGQ